jgi:hypothetical protein
VFREQMIATFLMLHLEGRGINTAQGSKPIEPDMPCKQSIYSLSCLRFSHESGHAPAITTAERP